MSSISGLKGDSIEFRGPRNFSLPNIRDHSGACCLWTKTVPKFIKRITVGRRTGEVPDLLNVEKGHFLFYLFNREIVVVY